MTEQTTEQKIGYGERITKIRKAQPEAKTLEKFGALLTPPASRGLVKNWENENNMPNKQRLEQIAEIGGVTTDYILYGPMNIQRNDWNYLAELEKKIENSDIPKKDIRSLKHMYEENMLLLYRLVSDEDSESISFSREILTLLDDFLNDSPYLLLGDYDEEGKAQISNQLAQERLQEKREKLHQLIDELADGKIEKYADYE